MKLYSAFLFSLTLATLTSTHANAAESSAARFLETAVRGSTAEIALGKMAQAEAKNEQVRAFASRMVQDHGKALEQARQAAQEMGIPIDTGMPPAKEKLAENLTARQGAEFDRTYMQAMVDGHQKTVSRFEKQAEEGNSKASEFASKQLPVLREHVAMARSISGELQQR